MRIFAAKPLRVGRRHAPTTGKKLIKQPWLAVGLQLLLGRSWDLRNGLPRDPKLLGNDVTHILEVLESLLEGIDGSGALCDPLSARIWITAATQLHTYRRSGFSCSSWPLKGGEWRRHRTRHQGYSTVSLRWVGMSRARRRSLLHDDVPQGVAQGVALVTELKRGCCRR